MEQSRPAKIDDLEQVVSLHRNLLEEATSQRGGELWVAEHPRQVPFEEGFKADIVTQNDSICMVVGTIEDVVLGFGVIKIRELGDGTKVGDITDLYVTPDARGVGLGEAMMNDLVDFAEKSGALGVDATALPGDRNTKNFFETAGLTARNIRLHRSL